ncbi:MAG: 2-dehydropantoate 2-reductase [Chloroflexota bacterium]
MGKKMAVLGTGAIGSSIGADLTGAGNDVLLIDQWPEHVEAMKAGGLRFTIHGEKSQVPVQAVHLCELAYLKPQFDLVFLACKSYDSRWLAQLINPYLKPDGVLVSTQNSLNDEWIAPIIGKERDIACALELSAEVFEPGIVKRNTDHEVTRFVIGELDGKVTPRVKEVAQIMGAVGKTEVSTNVWGAKWAKFVYNTMNSTLQAITGLNAAELIPDPTFVSLAVKLGRETAKVGVASGHTLALFGLTAQDFIGAPPETLMALLKKVTADIGKEAHSCVLQDLMKGRLTEVGDYFNGLVVKKGRELKIPTPANEAATAMVRQIEQGKLKPALANLQKLAAQIKG